MGGGHHPHGLGGHHPVVAHHRVHLGQGGKALSLPQGRREREDRDRRLERAPPRCTEQQQAQTAFLGPPRPFRHNSQTNFIARRCVKPPRLTCIPRRVPFSYPYSVSPCGGLQRMLRDILTDPALHVYHATHGLARIPRSTCCGSSSYGEWFSCTSISMPRVRYERRFCHTCSHGRNIF